MGTAIAIRAGLAARGMEFLRLATVLACACVLIAAGRALPF
ncbi:hypothetical protein FHS61_001148 [Altererythrobacter atlanticus]|nr:hypothetical protein [Croceibacterium atlanticum]MBB5732144.1 hypothetical protein [Croceibacterium atlanticum]